MTADIISLAEARQLRKADREPTTKRAEEPGRLSDELLRDMALVILASGSSG